MPYTIKGKAYTFDDLLLVPKYSEVISRSKVDTSVDLGKGVKLNIPIVSANMKNVTGTYMAREISNLGGLALLHRFTDDRITDYKNSLYKREINNNCRIGISVGVADSEKEFLKAITDECPDLSTICVDIAHGDSKLCVDMVDHINKYYPNKLLIAGNVATAEGAKRLADAGADVVKNSIGSGSLCSTRIETGNGIPTMQATLDIKEWLDNSPSYKVKLISDGGIRNSGDCTKLLCLTDAVMLGSMLAGTDESPGHTITTPDGKQFKEYAGSSTHKSSYIEGVTGLVPTKGGVKFVLNNLMEGIKSGMSYQGVDNLTDLKKNPVFVEITSAGLIESKPHDIILM